MVSKVYKGSGSGQFELVKTLNLSISSLKRSDINGDGLMDFVFKAKEDYSDNRADIYISLGTQSWESILEQIPSPIGGILRTNAFDRLCWQSHGPEAVVPIRQRECEQIRSKWSKCHDFSLSKR